MEKSCEKERVVDLPVEMKREMIKKKYEWGIQSVDLAIEYDHNPC